MTDGWLDPNKYEHRPITDCTGPGTMLEPSSWKFIGHTTESRPGSIEAVYRLFQGRPCSTPQLTIDPAGTQRRMQHIPWTWSGAALKGGSGCGMETNRWRSVQMEICDNAVNTVNWSDDVLWQIADVLADLIKDGCPINLDTVPDYAAMTGTVAVENAPQRLYGDDFRYFDGVGAHIIVGCNDHYDWYHANAFRIAELSKEILAGGGYVITAPPADPAPSPGPIPAPMPGYIMFGMEGGIVKFLQELLAGLGIDPGPIDGIFGQQTENAVRAYQASRGLDVDGIVGPQTQAAIASDYQQATNPDAPPPPAITPPPGSPAFPGRYVLLQNPLMSGDDIGQWQARMAERGWAIGVDGVYGPQSEAVCRSFQAEKGLEVDGVVGPNTWRAAWTAPVT